MTAEHADARLVRKPWGRLDLRPWGTHDPGGDPIGEIWFERTARSAPEPALLLKLLFPDEPLSIQVHPDDAFARSIGLPHGKTEAWYILSATRAAKVALGLKQPVTSDQLRTAIEDGSIAGLVRWQPVGAGAVVLVPAGTIHAIGVGLVIAEIQQRGDTTFRLFDFGRGRELHVDSAMAVARRGPPGDLPEARRLTDARTLLASCPYFVLERIDLIPDSEWKIDAPEETWLLALEGEAGVGPFKLAIGEALFLEADKAIIKTGAARFSGIVAYPGSEPRRDLLQRTAAVHSTEARS
jgi:mannose-6-phosphate isomerase